MFHLKIDLLFQIISKLKYFSKLLSAIQSIDTEEQESLDAPWRTRLILSLNHPDCDSSGGVML